MRKPATGLRLERVNPSNRHERKNDFVLQKPLTAKRRRRDGGADNRECENNCGNGDHKLVYIPTIAERPIVYVHSTSNESYSVGIRRIAQSLLHSNGISVKSSMNDPSILREWMRMTIRVHNTAQSNIVRI